MNGKKMSGEITGKEMPGKKTIGTNMNNGNGKMTDPNMTGNSMPAQVLLPRATQRGGSGKKKFPVGWLLPVAALSFFLGHFWSYLQVVRGIVSFLVFSKFLAGLTGSHFLL